MYHMFRTSHRKPAKLSHVKSLGLEACNRKPHMLRASHHVLASNRCDIEVPLVIENVSGNADLKCNDVSESG